MTAPGTRVALLLTTPGWRGSGTSFRKIAAGLHRRGHDVVMVAGDAEVAERLAQPGVTVHHVPTGDTGRREVGAVRRLLDAHRTRVVLADSPRDVRIARYASLLRRRAIAWRYNLSRRDVPPDVLQRWLFGGLAAVVQQSRFGAERLRTGMPWLRVRREVTIPNGFDLAALAPDPEARIRWRARHDVGTDAPVVLTAGALLAEKSPTVVLEALAATGATWVLAGDGPLAADLATRAGALGVSVVQAGHLDPSALHEAMQAADLVVQPSPKELFPNVVAEAMALGCAVVGAADGATPEVLGDAGITFAPGDADALSRIVAAWLSDRTRRERLGAAARSRIAARFPLAAMEEGYDRLVRELTD